MPPLKPCSPIPRIRRAQATGHAKRNVQEIAGIKKTIDNPVGKPIATTVHSAVGVFKMQKIVLATRLNEPPRPHASSARH